MGVLESNFPGYTFNLGAKFDEVTIRFADNLALITSTEEYTYRDLSCWANRMANYMTESGLKPGDVVAIFNAKTVYSYSIMLASLKMGCIYVNLDWTSPQSRVKRILERCQPKKIFSDLEIRLENFEVQFMDQPFKEGLGRRSNTFGPTPIDANRPAYIMFTSGSTGFPKGAVISHQNLLNFIDWSQQTFGICTSDRFANVNPMYFDNSVFDFYSSLFSGATIVPVPVDIMSQPREIVRYIDNAGCTIWFSVPSMLVFLLTTKALTNKDFASIKTIIFGGEGFPKSRLKLLYKMYGKRTRLVNVYGPTECTCICSSYDIDENDFEDMRSLAPLGPMAPNFDFEIIHQNSVELTGELLIKGPNVGLGYYNDSKRSEQAFIQNPVHDNYRDIVYRTGDLVSVDSTGLLHFKGRLDNQIKHMGYRIELEEIEAACNSLEYINECGVIYRSLGDGLGRIEAFVVCTSEHINTNRVQSDLRALLPSYMLPRKVFKMVELPKNSNGKVDRVQIQSLEMNG